MNSNLNPDRLDRRIQNQPVVATNLYNTGLRDPLAHIAYNAALSVGVSGYEAWEAAREYCLTQRRRAVNAAMPPAGMSESEARLRYRPGYWDDVRRDAQAAFDECTALRNPFALQVAA